MKIKVEWSYDVPDSKEWYYCNAKLEVFDFAYWVWDKDSKTVIQSYNFVNYPYKQTNILEKTDNRRYMYITIPANSLGRKLQSNEEVKNLFMEWETSEESWAYPRFKITLDTVMIHPNGTKITENWFESNTTTSVMVLYSDNGMQIENISNPVTSSVTDITLNKDNIYANGADSDIDVNSYSVELYDENENFISSSGQLFDWWNTNGNYRIRDLKDKTNYKVKWKTTLNCGALFESDFYTLTTNFSSVPLDTEHITLANNTNTGGVNISVNSDTIHNKVVLSKSLINTNEWVTLKTYNTSNTTVSFVDYTSICNKEYIYKVSIYNNNVLVAEYANKIVHEFEGMAIVDITGSFATKVELSVYDISKNERATLIEPLDSKYAYSIISSNNNYYKGKVSGMFVPFKDDNCTYDVEQNLDFSYSLLEFLNNGYTKLLKLNDGKAWIVNIVGEPSFSEGKTNDTVFVSFEWVEIADKNVLRNYIDLNIIN